MSARTQRESQTRLIASCVASVARRAYRAPMTLLLIPGFMADATLWDALKDEMTDDLAPFGPLVATDLSRGEDIETMAPPYSATRPRPSSPLAFPWAAMSRASWRVSHRSGSRP